MRSHLLPVDRHLGCKHTLAGDAQSNGHLDSFKHPLLTRLGERLELKKVDITAANKIGFLNPPGHCVRINLTTYTAV